MALAPAAKGPLPLSELSADTTGGKPIRLILSDFDGTFTDHKNKVPEKNVEGFCLAKKLGLEIGFATGRGRVSTVAGIGEENAKKMKYEGHPGVFCNGSIVFGLKGEKLLDTPVSSSVQRRTLDALKQKGLLNYTIGLTEGDSFCLDHNKWTLICFADFSEDKPLLLPDEDSFYSRPFHKFMIWQEHDKLVSIRRQLEAELNDVIDFTMPYPALLELSAKGVHKGNGLHALANHLGLSPQEILVLGDSENDISMFKEAGIAVAVGDAQPGAKNAAMYQAVESAEGPLLHVVQTLQQKGLALAVPTNNDGASTAK